MSSSKAEVISERALSALGDSLGKFLGIPVDPELNIALRDDNQWLQDLLPVFSSLQSMTIESLQRLPWLHLEAQAGTAYVWPDVSALQMSDFEVAQTLMQEAAVLVSPGYQFGTQGDGHFRLCYARDESEWMAALDRMVAVLNNLAGKRGLEGIF